MKTFITLGWIPAIGLLLSTAVQAEPITFVKDSEVVLELDSDSIAGEVQIVSENDRLVYVEEAAEKAAKKVGLPLKFEGELFPHRAPEGQPYIAVTLVGWRLDEDTFIRARLWVHIRDGKNKEEIGYFVGRKLASAFPTSSERRLQEFKDAVSDALEDAFKKIKERVPESEA